MPSYNCINCISVLNRFVRFLLVLCYMLAGYILVQFSPKYFHFERKKKKTKKENKKQPIHFECKIPL